MKMLFYLILILNVIIKAQTGTIMGEVFDVSTKEKLIGVNIQILGTNLGAATDVNGKYIIRNIPIGTYQVRASAVGYETITKTDIIVSTGRPFMVDFQMRQSIIEIGAITATSDLFRREPTEVNSIASFSYEEIRRAPGGFEDVVRALAVLPGVAQSDPGRNDLVVRGGAPSENLFLVDGFVVPNINHFGTQGATGGPLSYINLDFVRETSFSTGGFSALYGDKLSSVLSIDLRNGRTDQLGGKLTISATQFGLNLEGPVDSKSSFIFSARRSYLDFIFKAAGFAFVPEYWDVFTKYNYNFDNEHSLSFLYISAFDNVRYFNDTEEKRYNNSRILGSDQIQYLTGVSYRNLFSNGYFDIRLSRNFIDYDTRQIDTNQNPIFKNKSLESENNLSANIFYKISRKSEITVGGTLKLIKFNADLKLPFFKTSFGETLSITELKKEERYQKADLFAQYSGYYFNHFRMNLGVRLDYFNAIENKFAVSPRFSLSFYPTEITSINFATGIYYQSPSYIWLLADERNKKLDFVRADQYILGFDHRIRYDVILKVEGFYKKYSNYPTSVKRPYLVLANTGAGFSGSDDNFASFGLEELVSSGKGFSRGFEFSIQKKSSDVPHYGLMSVTYSETKFTALDGIERYGKYDQRWIVNLSAGYIFNEKWEASLKFRFSTGSPYTPFNSDGSQDIDKYNSVRNIENHSLDLRIDRRFNFSGWNLIVYLDVQNVYNRKNSSFIRWDPKEKKVDNVSNIGILPSIGVSLEM